MWTYNKKGGIDFMKHLAFEKSVGGVVYRRQQDGDILYLLLRYRSWQWDFPKGHTEIGETEMDTLVREIEEETGLVGVRVLPNFRTTVRYFYSAKGNEKKERISQGKGIYIFKKVVFYAAETDMKDIRIDFENKDFAWLSYEQAYSRINNTGSKNVLNAAQKVILKRKIEG